MKAIPVLIFFLCICFTLVGQSHYAKMSLTHRNLNYATHNVHFGVQAGYSYVGLREWTLEASLEYAQDNSYFYSPRYETKERSSYLHLFALRPILKDWAPKGNLKLGFGYVGSLNYYSYPEHGRETSDGELIFLETNSKLFILHELGIIVDYNHALSEKLIIFGNAGLSAGLNEAPATMRRVDILYPGVITSLGSSNEPFRPAHFRFSLGVGYKM